MPLSAQTQTQTQTFIGTVLNDTIATGFTNGAGQVLDTASGTNVFVNGAAGNDVIATGSGNDLAAGDAAGAEWHFDGSRWVYDAGKVNAATGGTPRAGFDDVISTGAGNDVLLGNGGNDQLFAGAGNDTVNAGTGNDRAFGGEGNDLVNLDDGNDYAEGGIGADIINGGNGNDLIWGEAAQGTNLLAAAGATAGSFASLAKGGSWALGSDQGHEKITQIAQTEAGKTYTISFDLAANVAGGHGTAAVEVLWNGKVVETVHTGSALYETFSVDVTGTGKSGELSFRSVTGTDAGGYDFSGPIAAYQSTLLVAGKPAQVAAFAPGQAKLYQMIDGQLNVLDTAAKTYVAVGHDAGFKINATGFNIEDNLIYGVAKSSGTDSLGNKVKTSDIVAVDAHGDTYLVGKGSYGDYVGDFDDKGNLWTFDGTLNRLSVIDVDNRDAAGNPKITEVKLSPKLFGDSIYDVAYDASTGSFFGMISSAKNGAPATLVKIDVSTVLAGGTPTFTEISITDTLVNGKMVAGMAKGAYGAVFMDGEHNIYVGLNQGDHDLNNKTTPSGAIYKIVTDAQHGTAYAEVVTTAPAFSNTNDGAVDPRSGDAFAKVDTGATVLLRAPSLTDASGGNDSLRGGEGDDELHGNGGDDELSGGNGHDKLFGEQGNDAISAGAGNDTIDGGTGDDKLRGEAGNDVIAGGKGADYLEGGSGNDQLSGGAGIDKIVGGIGADVIEGGAGDDQLWGGDWAADHEADTFVFRAGCGKDMVQDFEDGRDLIDLSSFDTDYASVKAACSDQGWATVIDLAALHGGTTGDKLILKSVDLHDLGLDSFIL